MKLLFVGDVHAVPEELGDCEALMAYVEGIAAAEGAKVVFMGDQYHCHNVIRAEVMAFWRRTFKRFNSRGIDTVAMVGNHDFAGEGSDIHAMAAHEEQIHVVEKPEEVYPGILFCPYMANPDKLVAASAAHPEAQVLVCHQTFVGSKYENGFFAEDGCNPDDILQKHIISGHIHSPQSFGHQTPYGQVGEVRYIGAPRWRSLTDANVDRAVWLYEFAWNGVPVGESRGFDTGKVCRKIVHWVEEEGGPQMDLSTYDPRHDYRVDVRGSTPFVEQRQRDLGLAGIRVRTFKRDAAVPAVRESVGIATAFGQYLTSYVSTHGTSREVLAKMAEKRLGLGG